jgi:hypothetical protein
MHLKKICENRPFCGKMQKKWMMHVSMPALRKKRLDIISGRFLRSAIGARP